MTTTNRPNLAEFEERLEKGWQMIEDQNNPTIRTQYEKHWLRLLREYEQRYDAALSYIRGGSR